MVIFPRLNIGPSATLKMEKVVRITHCILFSQCCRSKTSAYTAAMCAPGSTTWHPISVRAFLITDRKMRIPKGHYCGYFNVEGMQEKEVELKAYQLIKF